MKTSIIQMLLGILVFASAISFSWQVEPGYHRMIGKDGNDGLIMSGLQVANRPAQIWFYGYAGLGLITMIAGIGSLSSKRYAAKARWSLGQSIVGLFVIVAISVYLLWIEPDLAPLDIVSEHTGNIVTLTHDPTWNTIRVAWLTVSMSLGLLTAILSRIAWRRNKTNIIESPAMAG